jgi:glycosyltransferase involved in cell wall biosynthesis
MPPKRIAHLITGLFTGGAERSLLSLVERLNREEFESVVISMTGDGDIGPAIRRLGIRVESLGMRRGVPSPTALVRLLSILSKQRPSLMQTWLYHADLLGLIATAVSPVPHLVWNVRCSEVDMSHYSLVSRATRRLLALTSAVPDVVIVNSEEGLRWHESYGYSPKRWMHIPNGIDTGRFQRDDVARETLRCSLGIGSDDLVVGTIGRFDPMKDYGTFSAAIARVRSMVPGLRVIMAGRNIDESNQRLMGILGAHGLLDSVLLLGQRSDVNAVLNAMDVYCLSSSFGEGFPNALVEAMACEIPVAVTDSGDSAAIVSQPEQVSPPRDDAALARCISRLAGMSVEARRRLGRSHRERVEQYYSVTQMVSRYEELYRGLTKAT